GSESGARVKRIRADSAVSREPAQALDAPEPEPDSAPAPPAFLSPYVKEYLELGMAIPGALQATNSWQIKNESVFGILKRS
ncbi:Uncharacterized protein OBRU01_21424, partial [Operophtera brumata]